MIAVDEPHQLRGAIEANERTLLVIGGQEIVADVPTGLRRIDEYCFPLEDQRASGLRRAERREQGPHHQ